jgi:uncharacterized protein (DUF488 family)
MKLFTIGFTGKRAVDFFGRLRRAGVKRVIDVRLNNTSQLSGFAKRDDLAFFAKELCGADYVHRLDLAPTPEMLSPYRKGAVAWSDYAQQFERLIASRHIERADRDLFCDACLLCSEDKPHHCHRRVVAEYLQRHWTGVVIEHL